MRGLWVIILNFLYKEALNMPTTNPINIDRKPSFKKSKMISKGIEAENGVLGPAY